MDRRFRETHCLNHGRRLTDVLDVPAALVMRTEEPSFQRILIPSSPG